MAKRIPGEETPASQAGDVPAEIASSAVDELLIEMSPIYATSSYSGSRASLEAEGIIPAGTEWPTGFASVTWDAGPFHFYLQRVRPEGVKGPRKDFAECDRWRVHWIRINRVSWRDREIARKARELERAIYLATDQGQKDWDAQYRLLCAARDDRQFQAFKTLIPGLVPPKRGRKPRSQGDSNVQ